MPVAGVRTQAADIDQTITQEIVFARLCTAFAVLALIIASVGLYGTMAYTVARQTREIGIRVALGARRGAVIWMVLREVCVLAAAGLAIGVPIALGTSRFVEAFLFGTKPNDPMAIAIAVAILVGAALAAGFAPARRASRIDPMVALRTNRIRGASPLGLPYIRLRAKRYGETSPKLEERRRALSRSPLRRLASASARSAAARPRRSLGEGGPFAWLTRFARSRL